MVLGTKTKKKLSKKQTKDVKSSKKIETAEETFLLETVDKNGIGIQKGDWYSKTFDLSDINYFLADRDKQLSIFSTYCDFLNSFDNDVAIQLNIRNRKKEVDLKSNDILLDLKGDSLDVYRQEMNDLLEEKVAYGNNNVSRERYITFSKKGTDAKRTIGYLNRLEIQSSLSKMGVSARPLDGLEMVQLLNDMVNQKELKIEKKRSVLNTISPKCFDFKSGKVDRFKIDNRFVKVLHIKDYPNDISDKFIADLTELEEDIEISIQIEPFDTKEALSLVQTKLTFMEQQKIDEQKKAIQAGYDPDMLPPDLKSSIEEAKDLRDKMQTDNQKLFRMSFLIMLQGKSEVALANTLENVENVCRTYSCELFPLQYLQEEAFNSVLPFAKNQLPKTLKRTMTTSSVGVFIPFVTKDLFQKNGIYYGVNSISKNLITFDRKSLKAPNGFILGTPGSGKSFSAKREISSVALKEPDSEIIIIDPEGEYAPLVEGLKGEVIKVAPNSLTRLNPFEINMDNAQDEDPFFLKTDFVLTLCELLFGGKEGLSGIQRTIVDRACRMAYKDFYYTSDHDSATRKQPTFTDFYEAVKSLTDVEGSQQLALELELYIKGSLSTFAYESNVNINKNIVVFDIKDLGNQLKTMGMLIVLDLIWNRIVQNRERKVRTYIYIDEIQLLFSNEYSSGYFFELWSRARKWGAIPTGITQNVETLLLSDHARRMLSNSDFILLLNQATSDRKELVKLKEISSHEEKYVTNSPTGQGLMFADGVIIPFQDSFPTNTKLYEMMTTKFEDIKTPKKLLGTSRNE